MFPARHIIILALALLLCGCELFTTREPETPTSSSGSDWVFPSEPGIALTNIQSAVGRRSSVDYLRGFGVGEADSFTFVPDIKTEVNYPGRFDNWDLARERKFAESIFNPAALPLDSIAECAFEVERLTVLADSALLSARYTLHLGHTLENAPLEMAGRAEFRFRRQTDGSWKIGHWTDYRSTGWCWSDLKAQF